MTGTLCQDCGRTTPEAALRCPSCGSVLDSVGTEELATLARRIGQALGEHYRVEELVGRGGAAYVFRVTDLRLNRDLAAKVLHPRILESSETALRFRQEAETAAKLSHPNIVPIFFIGGDETFPCFVMPLIVGETLRARMSREGQLAIDVAMGITRDIANALDFANQCGVIHRDVKPDNILLEAATGRSLLMDFGVAKALQTDRRLTSSGMVVGTPYYVSPEQASGEASLDARSDVYSLGIVVYEMLAGELPFTGDTAQAVFAKHVATPCPSVRVHRPEITSEFDAVLQRALAKSPDERFASAGEFVRTLQGQQGRAPVRQSGATVLPQQARDDLSMFRKLKPTDGVTAPRALIGAEDVATVIEAVETVEKLIEQAARDGHWVDLTTSIHSMKRRADDHRPAFREPAVKALGRLGAHPAVVEALANGWRVGDDEAQVRVEYALGCLGGVGDCLIELACRERSAPFMLLADRVGVLGPSEVDEILADHRAGVVEALLQATRESTRPAETVERWLTHSLRHKSVGVRQLALEVAAERGGAMAERVGRMGLSDGTVGVRVAALRTMGRSKRKEALHDVARRLENGARDEQVAAALALADLPFPDSVRVLERVFDRKKLLKLERGPVQEAAVVALTRLPAEMSLAAVRRLAEDQDKKVSAIASHSLAEMDAPARQQ